MFTLGWRNNLIFQDLFSVTSYRLHPNLFYKKKKLKKWLTQLATGSGWSTAASNHCHIVLDCAWLTFLRHGKTHGSVAFTASLPGCASEQFGFNQILDWCAQFHRYNVTYFRAVNGHAVVQRSPRSHPRWVLLFLGVVGCRNVFASKPREVLKYHRPPWASLMPLSIN